MENKFLHLQPGVAQRRLVATQGSLTAINCMFVTQITGFISRFGFLSFISILCLFFLFLAPQVAKGQSIGRHTMGIAGGSASDNGLTISWTVGEVAVQRGLLHTGDVGSITEGFQQPHVVVVATATEVPFQVSVFPNPVQDVLRVNLIGETDQSYQINLMDHQGRQLNRWANIPMGTHDFNVDALPAGMYYLAIRPTGAESAVKSFKIMKIKS